MLRDFETQCQPPLSKLCEMHGGEWVKIGVGDGAFYRLANSIGVLVNRAPQTDNLESPIKNPHIWWLILGSQTLESSNSFRE